VVADWKKLERERWMCFCPPPHLYPSWSSTKAYDSLTTRQPLVGPYALRGRPQPCRRPLWALLTVGGSVCHCDGHRGCFAS